jgi:hypothetical protein
MPLAGQARRHRDLKIGTAIRDCSYRKKVSTFGYGGL